MIVLCSCPDCGVSVNPEKQSIYVVDDRSYCSLHCVARHRELVRVTRVVDPISEGRGLNAYQQMVAKHGRG